MNRSRKLLLGLFAALLLIAGSFLARSIVRYGEVLPGVTVAGVDIGGLGRADATNAILSIEDVLVTAPAVVAIEGTSFPLDPAQVEFALEVDAVVEEALDAGRGSGFTQFADWVTRHRYQVGLRGRLSSIAVEQLIDGWEATGITTPAFNGSVRYENGTVVADPPRSGRRVERSSAVRPVLEALLRRDDRTAVLEVVAATPLLTAADVEQARRRAADLVAEPIVLESGEPPISVVFSPADLGGALISRYVAEPSAALTVEFDPERVAEKLAPLRATLEAPPRDAAIITTEDDRVVIVPGIPGTVIDPELVAAELVRAAATPARRAPLPLATGVEPDFTTADAEALGITGKVSEFTTYFPCCQPRVTNIQRMADLVDGVIVMPGESFSLNEHVGERTVENGFVEAPMILRGEFVPAVGGGVSQFATTLFNAIFFGGYEDVSHQPHSYYFTRYPEGREATVSYPNPELIFRNDTSAAVLIRTKYTDESITVAFFGDNGGRRVTDALSPRRSFRSPATEYVTDAGQAPGTEVVLDGGAVGWTVTVTRTIAYPDGSETTEDWDWTYRPQPRRVRVHPCNVPGTSVTCPTTTTLPPPTTTTTTSPPPTTTTSSTSTTTSSTSTTTTSTTTVP